MSRGFYSTGFYHPNIFSGPSHPITGSQDVDYDINGGSVTIGNANGEDYAVRRNVDIHNGATVALVAPLFVSGTLRIREGSLLHNNGLTGSFGGISSATNFVGGGLGYPGNTNVGAAGELHANGTAGYSFGGSGANGGNGTTGNNGGVGGTATWVGGTNGNRVAFPIPLTGRAFNNTRICGGASGGAGGGGGAGNIGGGGGGGGGVVHIIANEVILENASRIEARGATGGDASYTDDSCGGGGGGGGGSIVIIASNISISNSSYLDVRGGAGGLGGNGDTGRNGGQGSAGGIYIISESGLYVNIQAGTIVQGSAFQNNLPRKRWL